MKRKHLMHDQVNMIWDLASHFYFPYPKFTLRADYYSRFMPSLESKETRDTAPHTHACMAHHFSYNKKKKTDLRSYRIWFHKHDLRP